MKVGDFVCYAKESPLRSEDCGEWYWDHGLMLSHNIESQTVDIMTDGEVYRIRVNLVQKIERDHWHPGMNAKSRSRSIKS